MQITYGFVKIHCCSTFITLLVIRVNCPSTCEASTDVGTDVSDGFTDVFENIDVFLQVCRRSICWPNMSQMSTTRMAHRAFAYQVEHVS
jgi:hypothetical protein